MKHKVFNASYYTEKEQERREISYLQRQNFIQNVAMIASIHFMSRKSMLSVEANNIQIHKYIVKKRSFKCHISKYKIEYEMQSFIQEIPLKSSCLSLLEDIFGSMIEKSILDIAGTFFYSLIFFFIIIKGFHLCLDFSGLICIHTFLVRSSPFLLITIKLNLSLA